MAYHIPSSKPLNTYIGQLVVTATNSTQTDVDKQIVRKICLTINTSPDKWMTDTLKTLKQCWTLSLKTGNYLSASHALEVLDACILSCGNIFRALVLRQGLLRDLTKSLGQLSSQPTQQNKLLSYIQVWGVSFADVPGLMEYDFIYQELKAKKFVFWPVDAKKVEPYRRALVKDQLSSPAGSSQPVRRGSPQPGRRGSPQPGPQAAPNMRRHTSPPAPPGHQVYRPQPSPQYGPQQAPRPTAPPTQGPRPSAPPASGQRSSVSRPVSARYPNSQQARPQGRQSRPRSYHPPSDSPNQGPAPRGQAPGPAPAPGPSKALLAMRKELAKAKIQCQLAHDLLQTQDSADSPLDRDLLKELQIGCVGCQKKLLSLLQNWDLTDEFLGDVFRMTVELHSTIIRCKDILLRPQAPPSYYSVAMPRPLTPPPSYDTVHTPPLIPDLAPPSFSESQPTNRGKRKSKGGKTRSSPREAPPGYEVSAPPQNGSTSETVPGNDMTNEMSSFARELQSLTEGNLIDFDTTPPGSALQAVNTDSNGGDFQFTLSENMENLDNESRETVGAESQAGATNDETPNLTFNDLSSAEGTVQSSHNTGCDINDLDPVGTDLDPAGDLEPAGDLDPAGDLEADLASGGEHRQNGDMAQGVTSENRSKSNGAENAENNDDSLSFPTSASVEWLTQEHSRAVSDRSFTAADSSASLPPGGMANSQLSGEDLQDATSRQMLEGVAKSRGLQQSASQELDSFSWV